MKRVVSAAMAVLAFGFTNAQDSQNMSFGVKGGLNMSNYTGDIEIEVDNKIGFFVGGFVEFKVSDKFAVQPEILYSNLGAKNSDVTLEANYILVPLMAKFFVTEQFSLEAGPQVGFLMTAKLDDDDIKDGFKSTDFAANFGVGYDVTENISIGLRYSLGLTNVIDLSGADVKTSNFALALAYKF